MPFNRQDPSSKKWLNGHNFLLLYKLGVPEDTGILAEAAKLVNKQNELL